MTRRFPLCFPPAWRRPARPPFRATPASRSSATAVPRDAGLQEQRDAARGILSKVKHALLGPFAQMIESKREEAATLEEGRNAEQGALLERLSSQAKGIDSELNMPSDAAGLRSVCELYSAAEDEEIEARARRNRSKV